MFTKHVKNRQLLDSNCFYLDTRNNYNTRGNPTMGYAIFTARKLMLTNRVNQLSMRIMQLSQQQQTLSDNAGRMERAIANTRNLFSNIGNAFQMGMTMQQQAMSRDLMKKIQESGGDYSNPAVQSAMASIGGMLGNGANFMSTPMGMGLQLMNQSIETMNESKMRQIKEMENQIELERKSLETQLNAAQKELEKVEQAEEKNIERSAPKFA